MCSVCFVEDGTIQYPFPEDGVSRINYTYITSNKFCGDEVDLKILRDGTPMNIKVTLDAISYLGDALSPFVLIHLFL